VSRRLILVLVLCLSMCALCGGSLFAQDHTPKEYSSDEFPRWLKDLFRAEAITIGSFPITLFLTLEAYDTYRYVTPQGQTQQQFNPSYAPWPFGSGTAAGYSAQETLWLAVSAVSLSVVIAGIDFLIGRINESSAGR
jgi:hypothetical protein